MSKKNMAAKCRQAMSVLSMLTLCSLGPVSAVGAAPSPNAPSTKLSTPILSTQTVAVELAVEMAVDGESNEVTDSRLLEEALSVAESMEDTDYKSMALAGIARSYTEKDDFGKADNLLAQALQILAQNGEPELNRSKVFNRIAVGYFEIGEKERAIELLQQSLASIGEVRASTRNYEYLLEIIDLYAKFGEADVAAVGLEEATQFSDEIDDWSRQSYAIERIAIAYAQLDDKAIMAAVYGQMPDSALKREGLASLTQAANSVAYSAAQQKLPGAIALAYNSTDACQLIPTGNWAEAFSPNATCQ